MHISWISIDRRLIQKNIHPSIRPSVHPSIHPTIHPICTYNLCVSLFVCLSFYLPIYLSIYLRVSCVCVHQWYAGVTCHILWCWAGCPQLLSWARPLEVEQSSTSSHFMEDLESMTCFNQACSVCDTWNAWLVDFSLSLSLWMLQRQWVGNRTRSFKHCQVKFNSDQCFAWQLVRVSWCSFLYDQQRNSWEFPP